MPTRSEKAVAEEWGEILNEAAAAHLWKFPYKQDGSNYSDIRDDEGKYYIDLVLGGGGMLGLAHTGYIHALEESDLSFRAIAGTSACALSAALLAGIPRKRKWKGLTLGALLASLNGDELLDNWRAKLFFRWRFQWRLPGVWVFGPILAIDQIFRRGLISGELFEKKLENTLRELQETQVADPGATVDCLSELPRLSLSHVTGEDDVEGLDRMKLILIASDITTERILKLPEEDSLFDEKYSVPFYVRASASVPGVFRPVRMKCKPVSATGYRREPPVGDPNPWIDVVDGGLMSNFPIRVFHRRPSPGSPGSEAGLFRQPRLPTFGLQLLPLSRESNKTRWPWQYVLALGSSMLDVGDETFINTHPEYKRVVRIVDISDLEPFNLYLDKKTKIDLFVRGYLAGKRFLQTFDWHGYKQLRREMAHE